MEYFRTIWCPFEADFSTSSYAQINRGSIFEVDGIKRRLSSTIGVKQGDLLGPELFVIVYGGSDGDIMCCGDLATIMNTVR